MTWGLLAITVIGCAPRAAQYPGNSLLPGEFYVPPPTGWALYTNSVPKIATTFTPGSIGEPESGWELVQRYDNEASCKAAIRPVGKTDVAACVPEARAWRIKGLVALEGVPRSEWADLPNVFLSHPGCVKHASAKNDTCVEMWVPSSVRGEFRVPLDYKNDQGPVRYWMWLASLSGEAHSTHPYDSLETCLRDKAPWRGVRFVACLTISPYGQGPFYIYADDGASFQRTQDTGVFQSLDACDVARRPFTARGIALSCLPQSLQEPL